MEGAMEPIEKLELSEKLQLTEKLDVQLLYGWDDRSFSLFLFLVALLIGFFIWWLKPPRNIWWVAAITGGVTVASLLLIKLQPIRQIVVPALRWLVR